MIGYKNENCIGHFPLDLNQQDQKGKFLSIGCVLEKKLF